MTSPVRLQLSRQKGFNLQDVSRDTNGLPAVKVDRSTHELLSELRGKNLACWCKPGAPCHADVLIELANGPRCEEVQP